LLQERPINFIVGYLKIYFKNNIFMFFYEIHEWSREGKLPPLGCAA
jgi:hypothetical protein